MTSSMDSTSCAVTTSWAFLFSTKVVTVLTPAQRIGGPLRGDIPLPGAFFSAWATILCIFSCFVSGMCLWELQQLSSCLVVQGPGEPVNGRRHFQTRVENNPLPLQLNVAGPFEKADEVLCELDVLSSAKILRPFLTQEIYHLLGLLFPNSRGWCHLLPVSLLFFQHLGWQEERQRKGNCGKYGSQISVFKNISLMVT